MKCGPFPLEIFLQICEELCQHCQEKHLAIPRPDRWGTDPGRCALLNLCLVSRDVRAVAQQVLYHHFGYTDGETSNLDKFCRTICSNPELGKYLRWADLSSFRAKVDQHEMQGWLRDAIERFSRHLFPSAQRFLKEGPDCALAPLVLLQAPNLERVDDDGKSEGVLFDMLAWEQGGAVCEALPQRLSTVWLGGWVETLEDNYKFRVDLSMGRLGRTLGSLQGLRSLAIHCPWFSAVDKEVVLQNLRVLRLGEFLMPPGEFERLISCTPLLEEFSFFYLGGPGSNRGDTATIPELLSILAKRKHTLRRLLLDASCTSDDLGGLTMFEHLEELKICAGPLATPQQNPVRKDALVRALPPSLRKLHVISLDPGLELAGEALMTYISSTYRASPGEQRLQKVYIDVYEEPGWRHILFREALEDRCREWAKHGTVVVSERRFPWYDMGDWGSGNGVADNRDE